MTYLAGVEQFRTCYAPGRDPLDGGSSPVTECSERFPSLIKALNIQGLAYRAHRKRNAGI
jgi:hypothetical protein